MCDQMWVEGSVWFVLCAVTEIHHPHHSEIFFASFAVFFSALTPLEKIWTIEVVALTFLKASFGQKKALDRDSLSSSGLCKGRSEQELCVCVCLCACVCVCKGMRYFHSDGRLTMAQAKNTFWNHEIFIFLLIILHLSYCLNVKSHCMHVFFFAP